jgi:hypothetical protein
MIMPRPLLESFDLYMNTSRSKVTRYHLLIVEVKRKAIAGVELLVTSRLRRKCRSHNAEDLMRLLRDSSPEMLLSSLQKIPQDAAILPVVWIIQASLVMNLPPLLPNTDQPHYVWLVRRLLGNIVMIARTCLPIAEDLI